MIPLCRDATRRESILMYWNKSMRRREKLKPPSCTGIDHVHKTVEFNEITQADELSFCVRLLWNIHYETILLRHVPQLMAIFNTSKRSHASLKPGKAGSCKQPLNYDYSHHFFRAHSLYLTIVADNPNWISCMRRVSFLQWHLCCIRTTISNQELLIFYRNFSIVLVILS